MNVKRDYVAEHFAEHPRTPAPSGYIRCRPEIVCKDGTRYSVQASASHYCSPKDSVGPWFTYEVWGPGTKDPEGWVPAEVINNRILRHGGSAK